MALREFNCPTKLVQRDGWVERETQFLVECYNQNQDRIGKNKMFASKKEFFKAVSLSMADQINSSKTAEQVSSRFYTLTRKPKTLAQPSSDLGTIINMSDATIVEAASLHGLNQMDSVAFNDQIVIDLDVSDAANNTQISMPQKPVVSLDGEREDLLTPNMIESAVGGYDKSLGRDKIESVGMLSAFSRKRLSFPRFSESHRSQHSNIGIATVYNNDAGNFHSVKSASRNLEAAGNKEITFGGRSSLERMAHSSAATNCTVTSGALNALRPIRTFPSDPVSAHATVDEEPLRDAQSLSANNDDEDHSSVENYLHASSGRISLQRRLSSSDFASDFATLSQRVTSVVVHKDPLNAMLTPHTQKSSGVIGRPAIAIQSQQAANIASSSKRGENIVDCSTKQIFGLSAKQLTPLNQPKNNGKGSSAEPWTKDETMWLLEKYHENMDEIGPLKTYRTKKEMWEILAENMSENYPAYRTGDDLSKKVQSIINQKKKAVENNRKSGASRVNVEYEDLISKIAAVDDSIEPEVMRDASSVYYKKKPKGRQPSKKPRWDKPNKKAILNTLSDTMLDIEKRRAEKEKSKEERRKETHSELLELIRAMKK